MSWLYSRALVEASSGQNSLDGEPCALWNTTPTRPVSWLPDKTTGACRLSQSGMTCALLTDDRGEAVLTWCLEVSHARTSARQDGEKASPESEAASGPKWRGLSVKFDRDTCSWKTHHCLFPEVLEWSSLTLPRWGMMRLGELWERITPGLPTRGIGSGLWPTPRAGKTTDENEESWKERKEAGKVSTPPLSLAVKMWLTPAARDSKGANSREHCESRGTGRKHMDQLANAVAHTDLMLSTPTASIGGPAPEGKTGRELSTVAGGQLNPDWVEWLMGWIVGWTSLEPIKDTSQWEKAFIEGKANWWADDSDLPKVTNGTPKRAARLKCIGNGQVPLSAATAFLIITED